MFSVDVTKNVSLEEIDLEDESVSDAIESVYCCSDFDTSITWYFCWFFLSRSGCFSDIYNDVIRFLKYIEDGKKEFSINFLSASFTCRWEFFVSDNDVRVTPIWFSVARAMHEGCMIDERKLQAVSGDLLVDRLVFVNEWRNYLAVIKRDLLCVGYSESLEGFEYL